MGIKFVRWQISTQKSRATGNLPYTLVYGQRPQVGISALPLSAELLDSLSTEAELCRHLKVDPDKLLEHSVFESALEGNAAGGSTEQTGSEVDVESGGAAGGPSGAADGGGPMVMGGGAAEKDMDEEEENEEEGEEEEEDTCRVTEDGSSAYIAQGQQAAIVNSEGGWFANDAAMGVLVCKLVLFANQKS